ncbi:hypothetical protein CEXT_602521 [Caerostris extrusa]|uniref:Uncharacterized protein n=1 Tax=Caerostris extrusa TaxID=172846 RepID=A0AAV4XQW5_CAEEX|nr:hypothetical protein CEXT_602521 [Caerostris extrusa]
MNREKADMHLIYCAANGNGSVELQLHIERFSNKRMSNQKRSSGCFDTFVNTVHCSPELTEGLEQKIAPYPNMEETILNIVDETPYMSARGL